MPKPRFEFSWECPECGKVHHWDWSASDEPDVDDEINMHCDGRKGCKVESIMRYLGEGKFEEALIDLNPVKFFVIGNDEAPRRAIVFDMERAFSGNWKYVDAFDGLGAHVQSYTLKSRYPKSGTSKKDYKKTECYKD
jgi:hypothetical protein